MKHLILKIIKLYQKSFSKVWSRINPGYGCRFYPSCSEYCIESIEKYGIIKGLFKGARRVLRCNPFNKGGIDLC